MVLPIAPTYPLSPAQSGILFHTLHADTAGLYVLQSCYTFRGALDEAAFRRTWEWVVQRHAILRTAFLWEQVDRPVQVIMDRATLPITWLDWSDLDAAEQVRRLDAFLDQDRHAGFDLSTAPLARAAIVRMSPDRFCFVWSHQHLLLDGWSNIILLKEAIAQYAALTSGRELQLAQPRPYGDYLAWLERQDWRKTESYWRGRLRQVTEPTPLPLEPPSPHDAAPPLR